MRYDPLRPRLGDTYVVRRPARFLTGFRPIRATTSVVYLMDTHGPRPLKMVRDYVDMLGRYVGSRERVLRGA